MVIYVYGVEVYSIFDGYLDVWFIVVGDYGNVYMIQNGIYLNVQLLIMLWYYDYIFGILRVNVLVGLVGLYIIRFNEDLLDWMLKEKFEIQFVLQDK